MNSPSSRAASLGLALGASILLPGCVGTGPNTQQGAVNGAAIGAIAGAVIGNNSGHRTLEGAAIGAAAGAIAGGTLGNAEDHRQGTIYNSPPPPAPVQTTTTYVVTQPPPAPPPRVERTRAVRPAPQAVWIGGYWLYDGRGYAWVAGHWEVPPPNCQVYVPARWVRQRSGGYIYVRGHWR